LGRLGIGAQLGIEERGYILQYSCTHSWTSAKQRCIATSITESEYIALVKAGKQSQWLRALLRELKYEQLLGDSLVVPLLSDNQACIAIV
jgi:hypothetical protein